MKRRTFTAELVRDGEHVLGVVRHARNSASAAVRDMLRDLNPGGGFWEPSAPFRDGPMVSTAWTHTRTGEVLVGIVTEEIPE